MAIDLGLTGDWRGSAWRKAMWLGAAALLALPAVAMRFTDEVNWTIGDFVVMGLIFAAAGAAVEVGMRMSRDLAYRAGVVVAVGGAFLLVWINLAVGVIGDGSHPANLVYLGMPLIGLGGALVARLRQRGMARTMLVLAAVQVLVAVLATLTSGFDPATPPVELIGLTLMFLVPWLLAAALFGVAARSAARGEG